MSKNEILRSSISKLCSGEQVVSNIPNPTARLIYLEEYSRNLEQVIIL